VNSRYLHAALAYAPVLQLTDDERKRLRKNFSPIAARRLTALPLLIGELTREANAGPDDEWFFASEFGGSISLEHYLESFPSPSPTHFQNSIQPGALDLVNVTRRQPARQLLPLIGGRTLFAEALFAALLSPADCVHVTGGEEFGEWSSQHRLGAPSTYAYYLRLSRAPSGAIGSISLAPDRVDVPVLPPEEAAARLGAREPLEARLPGRGVLQLRWK